MPTNRLPFKTYAEYLAERFPGPGKIQKIGVSIGLSCPNRDGTIGRGGCSYCNNASFSPDYIAGGADITGTLQKGIEFLAANTQRCGIWLIFRVIPTPTVHPRMR